MHASLPHVQLRPVEANADVVLRYEPSDKGLPFLKVMTQLILMVGQFKRKFKRITCYQ